MLVQGDLQLRLTGAGRVPEEDLVDGAVGEIFSGRSVRVSRIPTPS
jgi:hypothetical protein